jgi:hypothetical protein
MKFKGYEVGEDDVAEAQPGRRYFAVLESTVEAVPPARVGRKVVRLRRTPPRAQRDGRILLRGELGRIGEGTVVELCGMGVVEVTAERGKGLRAVGEHEEAEAIREGLAAEVNVDRKGKRHVH